MSRFVTFQAFPHSVLQPLPKRPALDKSSWASSLLSPSFLHYQQALANTQLQQATAAFYPTGEPVLCSVFVSTSTILYYYILNMYVNAFWGVGWGGTAHLMLLI